MLLKQTASNRKKLIELQQQLFNHTHTSFLNTNHTVAIVRKKVAKLSSIGIQAFRGKFRTHTLCVYTTKLFFSVALFSHIR